MKPGDAVQYFDAGGTNHKAVVLEVHGAGERPIISLVTVIEGKGQTQRNVSHREGITKLQPDRYIYGKGDPSDPDETKRPRIVDIVSGERKRTPGVHFWFE